MGNIEHAEDAKQLRDMVAVLYEQGKSATYILDAIDSYAVGAARPAPDQGPVRALEQACEITAEHIGQFERTPLADAIDELHGIIAGALNAPRGQ